MVQHQKRNAVVGRVLNTVWYVHLYINRVSLWRFVACARAIVRYEQLEGVSPSPGDPGSAHDVMVGMGLANAGAAYPDLNRYSNIVPYDSHRFKLGGVAVAVAVGAGGSAASGVGGMFGGKAACAVPAPHLYINATLIEFPTTIGNPPLETRHYIMYVRARAWCACMVRVCAFAILALFPFWTKKCPPHTHTHIFLSLSLGCSRYLFTYQRSPYQYFLLTLTQRGAWCVQLIFNTAYTVGYTRAWVPWCYIPCDAPSCHCNIRS